MDQEQQKENEMDQEQQREDESPVEASTATQSVEQANKEDEATKEASAAAQNVRSENGKADENPNDVAKESQSPNLKAPKSLKARSKISKKSSGNSSLKSNKPIPTTTKSKGKIVKKRVVVKEKSDNNVGGKAEGSTSGHENLPVDSMNKEATEMKNETILLGSEGKNDPNGGNNERQDVQAVPGGKPDELTGDLKGQGESHVKKSKSEKARWRRRKSQIILKEKEKLKSANSVEDQKDKEKSGGSDRGKKREKKEEKLGGLIFMCNKQTKPDCLRYGVMGVSESKKDFVLGIKPGLKLFLFDYDLKLLYGIYRASSAGGMKLEPRAFGGSFPAQVHFKVHMDCYPLPESDLKKAMKENYIRRNKFKTELNIQQVRKLTKLFRPVELHPSLRHHPSNSRARSPPKAGREDRNARPARELHHLSRRESDLYAGADLRRHPVQAYERERHDAMRERVPVRTVESPRDLFATEREYRAYGLQGERRNLEYEREPIRRQPEVMHLDALPARRDYALDQPSYLNGMEYQTRPLDARLELPSRVHSPIREAYADDPHYAYDRVAASRDAYTRELRRDNLLPGYASTSNRAARLYPRETEHARRDVDEIGRAYLTYPWSDYEQARRADASSLPVSSRYYYTGRRI